jgi:hypothetical protein
MGGELTQQLHLGLMTKSLARILLQVLKKLSQGLHYSFGDMSDSATNAPATVEDVPPATSSSPSSSSSSSANAVPVRGEVPHIVFPLIKMMDRFIPTNPLEEQPPPLGTDMLPKLNTDNKDKRQILADGTVYSMSFHSMYIDFVGWKTVNIPGIRDVDLHGFWGDSPLYITAYDLVPGPKEDGRHLQQQKRYFFRFKIENLGDVLNMDDEVPSTVPASSSTLSPSVPASPLVVPASEPISSAFPHTIPPSNDTEEPAISTTPPSGECTPPSLSPREVIAPPVPPLRNSSSQPTLGLEGRLSLPRENESLPDLSTPSLLDELAGQLITTDNLSTIRVPCSVELAGSRARYTPAFVVEVSYTEGGGVKRESVICMWEEAAGFYQKLPSEHRSFVGMPPSALISSSSSSSSPQVGDLRRKWLQETLQYVQDNETPSLRTAVVRWITDLLRSNKNRSEETFSNSTWKASFEKKHKKTKKKKHRHRTVTHEVACGRARWETQWREEFVVFYDDLTLRTYKFGSKHHELKVPLGSTFIRCTRLESEEQLPFASFHFLEVETVNRVMHFMFRTSAACESVARTLNHLFLVPSSAAPSSHIERGLADPRDTAFFKSELTERTVLNAKQMSFRTVKFVWDLKPCEFVAILLETILNLNSDSSFAEVLPLLCFLCPFFD